MPTAPLISSLASQQSTAMLELVLLRATLFDLVISTRACTLASSIFQKYTPWEECGKVKDVLTFDHLGFIPNSVTAQVA